MTTATETSIWLRPKSTPRERALAILEEAKHSGLLAPELDQQGFSLLRSMIEQAIANHTEATIEHTIGELPADGWDRCDGCGKLVHADSATPSEIDDRKYCSGDCRVRVEPSCGECGRPCAEGVSYCSTDCRGSAAADAYYEAWKEARHG